jgi:hypothetical protein
MHWEVYAVRSPASLTPAWRTHLCDGQRFYDPTFTHYKLQGIVGLVTNHDHRYPVHLCCFWSATVQRAARAALVRAGLRLIEGPFPIDSSPF